MYAEISAAVASAKTALDIAKAAHGLSNYNELVSAVSEVNTKLVQATTVALASLEKQSALASEIAELKDKLQKHENFQLQTERYVLEQLPFGGFAYALKKSIEKNQPHHYLCATCINKGEITILQPEGEIFLACAFNHPRVQIKNSSDFDSYESGELD